jgi:hypothetical protein
MECGGLPFAMGAIFVRHTLSTVAGPPLATAGAVADWLSKGGLMLACWLVTVHIGWLRLSLTMQYVGAPHEVLRKSTEPEGVPTVVAAGTAWQSALRARA